MRKPKPYPPGQLKVMLNEAQNLIEKCKQLVRRGEYLLQQGMIYHSHAQELIADCAVSGKQVSAMSEKLDKLLGVKNKQRTKTGEIILRRRQRLRRNKK